METRPRGPKCILLASYSLVFCFLGVIWISANIFKYGNIKFFTSNLYWKNKNIWQCKSVATLTQPGLSCSLPPRWGCVCFPISRSRFRLPAWLLEAGSSRSVPQPGLGGRNDHLKRTGIVLGGRERLADFLYTSWGRGAFSLWPSPLCAHTLGDFYLGTVLRRYHLPKICPATRITHEQQMWK